MIIVNRADQRRSFGHGNFRVQLTMPGINIDPLVDPGLLNLGRFDHAQLQPGAFVGMHKHRDDEILSLVKTGTMLHRDSEGHIIPITKNHLMMMNAGSGIFHEESIPARDYKEEFEMLQIFIRPASAGEPPIVQFADIPDGPANTWRLIAGPKKISPPLYIRSDIMVYDMHLLRKSARLPQTTFASTTWLLYVFAGTVRVNSGLNLYLGDSIIFNEEKDIVIDATPDAILIAFVMNTAAIYTRAGMFSGMQ